MIQNVKENQQILRIKELEPGNAKQFLLEQ